MKKIVAILLLCVVVKQAESQSWRHVFTDSLLQSYIAEALEKNSDIKIAQLTLQQSEAMLKSAKLTYVPTFALSPSVSITKERNTSVSTTYAFPLTMTWELNFGGKQHFEKDLAKIQLKKDTLQLKSAQIQIIADLANAYYTLIMLDNQYAVTMQGFENQKETVRVLKALKDAGQQNEIAVSQAEASLQNVSASLPILESQIKKVENAICLLLTREYEHVERVSWQDAKPINIDTEQEIPLERLSARPDVLATEYALKMALGNVKIARSELYPTLTISASAGLTDLALNAVSGLVQPLFAQRQLKANHTVVKLQYEQVEIAFKQSLLTASNEVCNALTDCRAFEKREKARTLQVESAQKAYETTHEIMQYSQVSYLEVLTAQNSYLEAQLQLSADKLELQQSFINLYKATCYE